MSFISGEREQSQMEHMDLHQPTIQNEEQKKSKLHARDGEDDTSYPSEKCGKHMLELPDEKPALEVHKWTYMFDFERCTSETTQVYKDLIVVCEKEIQDCEKAFNEASNFFETKFGNLKEKQTCPDSSNVIKTFRYTQEAVKRSLDIAKEFLPSFREDVKNYIDYRNGPLSAREHAERQYGIKHEQLAETPNVEKIIKWLLYDVKDYKEIEHRSGLTERDLYRITFYFGTRKNIYIPFREDLTMEEELTMEKEQFSESEMEDLLVQHKVAMEEVSSSRIAYETSEAIVKKHIQKHELAVFHRVLTLEGALKSADYSVRIMHRQLKLLLLKDVINIGYDEFFDDDWETVCRIPYN